MLWFHRAYIATCKTICLIFKSVNMYNLLYVVSELPVRHVSLASKPQPVSQHLCLSNSSAVQIRIPSERHFASASANVATRHDFGVTQVRPSLLQHLTAPFFELDGFSIGVSLSMPFGNPGQESPRLPKFY